jgi:hypothetical protein
VEILGVVIESLKMVQVFPLLLLLLVESDSSYPVQESTGEGVCK